MMEKDDRRNSRAWIIAGALAGVSAAYGSALVARYRRDLRFAERRLQTGSQVAETACGPIEYAEIGEGFPALIVHGATGGYDQGLFLAQLMQEAGDSGLQFIAMSRFGYLRTPLPPNSTPERQADAHAALMDALKIEKAIIIGASAGGPSTLLFALRHPERCQALVLVSAISHAMDIRLSVINRLAQVEGLSDFVYWLTVRAPWLPIPGFHGVPSSIRASLTPAERAWVTQFSLSSMPIRWRAVGILNDLVHLPYLPPYPLRRIRIPTLVIHAVDDPLVPFDHAEYSAQNIPSARLLALPQGGHLLVGQLEHVRQELLAFLASIMASAQASAQAALLGQEDSSSIL